MITLIDQRDANALMWRCDSCGTEFRATRTRVEFHECPEPEESDAAAVPPKKRGRPKKVVAET